MHTWGSIRVLFEYISGVDPSHHPTAMITPSRIFSRSTLPFNRNSSVFWWHLSLITSGVYQQFLLNNHNGGGDARTIIVGMSESMNGR
jgi:hypothetical protein